ncbi:hypothetical protein AQPE_2775 [Aquipluma nitroreducens]|uniref:Uncharacterized protein n=1 Tax=Aquipluma nitroreducens TaxID=2010828 RepID=A0A5K7SAN0_9BACT|nr:hypothetical protein AQPE_2775 [Aquipluma nitroreducens]
MLFSVKTPKNKYAKNRNEKDFNFHNAKIRVAYNHLFKRQLF